MYQLSCYTCIWICFSKLKRYFKAYGSIYDCHQKGLLLTRNQKPKVAIKTRYLTRVSKECHEWSRTWAHKVTPVFCGILVAQGLSHSVMFCRSLFVLFLLAIYFLFIDLWLHITLLYLQHFSRNRIFCEHIHLPNHIYINTSVDPGLRYAKKKKNKKWTIN